MNVFALRLQFHKLASRVVNYRENKTFSDKNFINSLGSNIQKKTFLMMGKALKNFVKSVLKPYMQLINQFVLLHLRVLIGPHVFVTGHVTNVM